MTAALAGDAPLFSGTASALVLAVAGWPISGLAPRVLRKSLVCRLALAWLLGAAWCGTAGLAASRLAGLPLRRAVLLAIVLLPWLLGLVDRGWRLGIGGPRRPSLPGFGASGIVAVSGAALLLGALTTPVSDWDGQMTWSPQARLIRAERTATPGAFTDAWSWVSHPQYPPLVALAEVTGLEIVAAPEDERAGRAVHPFFFVSLLAVLYRCLRVLTGSGPSAAVATSIAAMTPFLAFGTHGGAAGAFSDVPLAAFLGATLALLVCGTGGFRSGMLAGLLGAGAALTKNEGLPLVLTILLVGAGVLTRVLRGRRAGARQARLVRFARFGLPAMMLVGLSGLLLLAFRSRIPNRYDEDYAVMIAHADLSPAVLAGKVASVIPLLGARCVSVRSWGLLWPLLAFLAVIRPRALLTPAAFLAAALVALPVVLGFGAYSIHWNPVGLAQVSLDRFLVQGSFGAFLLLGLLVAGEAGDAGKME